MQTRRVHHLGTVAALAAALIVTGCGSSSGAPKSAREPNHVELKLVAYRPARLTVRKGATVTWTQRDPGVHTVTSGTVDDGAAAVTVHPDDRFDSGELPTGRTYTHRFAATGTYRYFCQIHPATMRGTVTVR
jgi:plastocyanin